MLVPFIDEPHGITPLLPSQFEWLIPKTLSHSQKQILRGVIHCLQNVDKVVTRRYFSIGLVYYASACRCYPTNAGNISTNNNSKYQDRQSHLLSARP